MAITRVGGAGSTSATPTVVALPAGIQAGDLILVFAFRDGSTTAPSAVSGYTTVGSTTGGNATSQRLQYKVADGTEGGTNVTVANATSVLAQVYRGVDVVAPIGGNGVASGTTNTASIPTLTMAITDGTSWVAAFMGHAQTNQPLETAPTGLTAVSTSADTIDEAGGYDTNGGVSSFAAIARTLTGTAAAWFSRSVELRAATATGTDPATFNPKDKSGNVTLSNQNLTATNTVAGTFSARVSRYKVPGDGLFYFEIKCRGTTDGGWGLGIVTPTATLTGLFGGPNSLGYFPDGSVWANNVQVATLATFAPGDIIGCALRLSGGVARVWFNKNGGAFNGSGDPVANTGGYDISGLTGGAFYFPMWQGSVVGSMATLNLAGPFTYTKPTGFSAYSTAVASPVSDLTWVGVETLTAWAQNNSAAAVDADTITLPGASFGYATYLVPAIAGRAYKWDFTIAGSPGTGAVEATITDDAPGAVDAKVTITGPGTYTVSRTIGAGATWAWVQLANFLDANSYTFDVTGSTVRQDTGSSQDGTGSGATLVESWSLIAGTASATQSGTGSGATLTEAWSLIPGAASATKSGNGLGAVLLEGWDLLPGTATGEQTGSDGTGAGATLLETWELTPGTAEATREGTAAGATLIETWTLTPGGATATREGIGSGATIAESWSLLPGTATATQSGTGTGATIAETWALIPGTAAGQRNAEAAGATLSEGWILLPGTATATRNETGEGVTLSETWVLFPGTATGEGGETPPPANDHAPTGLMLNPGRLLNRR